MIAQLPSPRLTSVRTSLHFVSSLSSRFVTSVALMCQIDPEFNGSRSYLQNSLHFSTQDSNESKKDLTDLLCNKYKLQQNRKPNGLTGCLV